MSALPPPPPTSIVNARFLRELPKWKTEGLDPLPQICFAGRSNVGKSSLINALTNQTSLARTSSTPGRTQAIVVFEAQLRREGKSLPFHLVDLPGYGYAKVPLAIKAQWGNMVEGYFRDNARIACCVFLMDLRRTPGDQDLDLLEMLEDRQVPILPVATKIDKVPRTQRVREYRKIAQALELEDYRDLLPVSAAKKVGLRELAAELFDAVAEADIRL